ncbi:MAG: M28 family peptidase [Clostridia bacterium]|nr:M28 family peptidase [Clostridia bacterium]
MHVFFRGKPAFKKSAALFLSLLCSVTFLMIPALTAAAEGEKYYGDVDLDGQVTATDARLILRRSVDLETFSEESESLADYDGNGSVSADDARLTLRASVGLEELKIQPPPDPPAPTKEELRAAWLQSFPDSVSYEDIDDNIRWIAEDIGVRSWWNSTQNNAGDSIYERLVYYGFTRGVCCKKLDFYRDGMLGRNILAVIPTKVQNPDILLVMAHYDTSRGTGGALDNTSGTVTLLQIAKRFLFMQDDYGVELRFLFTAGEEQGFYGANAYVNSLSGSEKARHKIVFNMDMEGKPNDRYSPKYNYYITVSTEPAPNSYYTSAAYANVGSRAVDEAKAALGNLGEAGYYSPVRAGVTDMIPFRRAGMPAITLSWRCIDYSRSHGSDYGLASPPYIDTSTDIVYYLDIDSVYNTARLVAASLARLVLPYTDLA